MLGSHRTFALVAAPLLVACTGGEPGTLTTTSSGSGDSTTGASDTNETATNETSPSTTNDTTTSNTGGGNVCEDGEHNAAESDVDCGGPDCDPCDDGHMCVEPEDCKSGICGEDFTCVAPSCTDAVANADETDVDCGGPDCDPCGDGQGCAEDTDCITSFCNNGTCDKECEADSDCADLDGLCTQGVCNQETFACEAKNINEGMACDDGSMCTDGTTCTAGACGGGTEVNCSALDGLCQAGVCDPASGDCKVEPADEGMPCDDLDPCTVAEVCTAGICEDPQGAAVWLEEDFANNDAGWVLGNKWEIGPAAASASGDKGSGADPAKDHSAGNDNGVAGVLIGDLTSGATPATYLVSPEVDVANVVGDLELSLWRWLNADINAEMPSTIEVWDGAMWVVVWENADQVIADAEWTEVTLDVTDHKNAQFRMRVGYQALASAGAMAGWNVDDVRLANPACP